MRPFSPFFRRNGALRGGCATRFERVHATQAYFMSLYRHQFQQQQNNTNMNSTIITNAITTTNRPPKYISSQPPLSSLPRPPPSPSICRGTNSLVAVKPTSTAKGQGGQSSRFTPKHPNLIPSKKPKSQKQTQTHILSLSSIPSATRIPTEN